MSVGVGRIFESVRLLVRSITQKRMITKCSNFLIDIGDILYKWHGFWLKGQRSTLGLGLTAIRRGFELYVCLLVQFVIVSWWSRVYSPQVGLGYMTDGATRKFKQCTSRKLRFVHGRVRYHVPLCTIARKRFARKRSARYRTPTLCTRGVQFWRATRRLCSLNFLL